MWSGEAKVNESIAAVVSTAQLVVASSLWRQDGRAVHLAAIEVHHHAQVLLTRERVVLEAAEGRPAKSEAFLGPTWFPAWASGFTPRF